MRAVIFLRGHRVAECELKWPEDVPMQGDPHVNDTISIAVVEDHPRPDQRPLFATGRLRP